MYENILKTLYIGFIRKNNFLEKLDENSFQKFDLNLYKMYIFKYY